MGFDELDQRLVCLPLTQSTSIGFLYPIFQNKYVKGKPPCGEPHSAVFGKPPGALSATPLRARVGLRKCDDHAVQRHGRVLIRKKFFRVQGEFSPPALSIGTARDGTDARR
jgi:hypothetical protein